MKIKFHNRKFYGKWNYKITLTVSVGAHNLKNIKLLDYSNRFTTEQKKELTDLAWYLSLFPSDKIQIRVEYKSVDIYTNDKKIIDEISEKFSDSLKHIVEVIETVREDSGTHVFVKKLPHDTYEYKVYLKPHTFKDDRSSKKQYLDWLDSQGSKIKISQKVKDWFMSTNWNWDRRYMYVEDESTLLMLTMRNPSAIGTVYRHVIIDK